MSKKKGSPITIFRLQGNGFQSTVLALNPVVRVGKTSGGERAERKDFFETTVELLHNSHLGDRKIWPL